MGSPLGLAVADLHPARSQYIILTRTPISAVAGVLVVMMTELGMVEDMHTAAVEDLHMAAVAHMVGGAVDLDVDEHVHDTGIVCVCYASGLLYRKNMM